MRRNLPDKQKHTHAAKYLSSDRVANPACVAVSHPASERLFLNEAPLVHRGQGNPPSAGCRVTRWTINTLSLHLWRGRESEECKRAGEIGPSPDCSVINRCLGTSKKEAVGNDGWGHGREGGGFTAAAHGCTSPFSYMHDERNINPLPLQQHATNRTETTIILLQPFREMCVLSLLILTYVFPPK